MASSFGCLIIWFWALVVSTAFVFVWHIYWKKSVHPSTCWCRSACRDVSVAQKGWRKWDIMTWGPEWSVSSGKQELQQELPFWGSSGREAEKSEIVRPCHEEDDGAFQLRCQGLRMMRKELANDNAKAKNYQANPVAKQKYQSRKTNQSQPEMIKQSTGIFLDCLKLARWKLRTMEHYFGWWSQRRGSACTALLGKWCCPWMVRVRFAGTSPCRPLCLEASAK